MRRKGFTLVELLVVISIIALLMAILMPALAKVKQLAHRMVCATNLSGIGKSMIMYSTDNHEEYPIAGPSPSRFQGTWGQTNGWQAEYREDAWSRTATATSSFYLLIKFADAQPKQFVCKGDVGSTIFKLSEALGVIIDDLTEAWDFGPPKSSGKTARPGPGKFCSYSYNMPYYWGTSTSYPVTTVTNPGCAIAADRNPYFDKNAEIYLADTTLADASLDSEGAYQDPDKKSSCAAHQRDGQNVLFNDSHVKFERFPNCGVNNDNIYKYWNIDISTVTDPALKAQYRQIGPVIPPLEPPYQTKWHPWGEEDSVLVNEVTYDY